MVDRWQQSRWQRRWDRELEFASPTFRAEYLAALRESRS